MSDVMDGKKILLVDDDRDILQAMSLALEPKGARILTASDGNRAVHLAETEKPDLVVLDMMLPKRSGFLVMEKLKRGKEKSEQPLIVMITGNMGTRHKLYATSLGVDEYINKPFRMEKLVKVIEEQFAKEAES